MIDAPTFDMLVQVGEYMSKNPSRPFGGIQVSGQVSYCRNLDSDFCLNS